MASLNDFLTRIRPHVKGCPDKVIKDHLIIVLRDICYRANIWRYSGQIYFVKGLGDYSLDAPAQTEVATVQTITRPDGRRLTGKDELPAYLNEATPAYYKHFDRGEITIAPLPSKGELCDVELTLMPAIDATEVPDKVCVDTVEFANWGVLAELQVMKDEAWYDPNLAEYNRKRFERELGRKRIRGLVGVSSSNQSADRRRFV